MTQYTVDDTSDDTVQVQDDFSGCRPRTLRELKDYVLLLTGDGRIVDEIGPQLVLLRSRGITGDRAADWIEHAALAARSKNDPGPYFRTVIQGCVKKGGTPYEIQEAEERRKALANAPVAVADRMATSGRMRRLESDRESERSRLEAELEATLARFRGAPEDEREDVMKRAGLKLGPRARNNPIVFEAVCASIFDQYNRSNMAS